MSAAAVAAVTDAPTSAHEGLHVLRQVLNVDLGRRLLFGKRQWHARRHGERQQGQNSQQNQLSNKLHSHTRMHTGHHQHCNW